MADKSLETNAPNPHQSLLPAAIALSGCLRRLGAYVDGGQPARLLAGALEAVERGGAGITLLGRLWRLAGLFLATGAGRVAACLLSSS